MLFGDVFSFRSTIRVSSQTNHKLLLVKSLWLPDNTEGTDLKTPPHQPQHPLLTQARAGVVLSPWGLVRLPVRTSRITAGNTPHGAASSHTRHGATRRSTQRKTNRFPLRKGTPQHPQATSCRALSKTKAGHAPAPRFHKRNRTRRLSEALISTYQMPPSSSAYPDPSASAASAMEHKSSMSRSE